MLDATNLNHAAKVYRATDPAQVIYRGLLANFSETELMAVENEIGAFDQTGLLPESLRAILDAGAELPAAA